MYLPINLIILYKQQKVSPNWSVYNQFTFIRYFKLVLNITNRFNIIIMKNPKFGFLLNSPYWFCREETVMVTNSY